MSNEPEYRTVSFYANIGKRPRRFGARGTYEPTLENITHDQPSKAQKVIACVKVEIRVPLSWLDRDGAPVFPMTVALEGEPRSTEGVVVDLLEGVVPARLVHVPAQEPIGEVAL